MMRLRNFAMLALIVHVIAFQARSADDVDCLVVEFFPFGDGNSLYDAEACTRVCNGSGTAETCNCTGCQEEWYIFTSNKPAEPCKLCELHRFASKADKLTPVAETIPVAGTSSRKIPVLKGADVPGLSAAKKSTFKFGSDLKTFDYKDKDGKTTTVDPKAGYQVNMTKWIWLKFTDGSKIPVKLYTVHYDHRRTNIPEEVFNDKDKGKLPVRPPANIGFEFEDMPPTETNPPEITAVRIIGGNKKACIVKLDDESAEFFVATSTAIK